LRKSDRSAFQSTCTFSRKYLAYTQLCYALRPTVEIAPPVQKLGSAMSELKAASETLFINPLAVPTASTTVDYKIDGELVLWRRLVGSPWTQENLIAGATTVAEAEALAREGTRTTPPVSPGQVLEYGLLARGVDANTPGLSRGRFDRIVTIYALLQVPAPANWTLPRPTFTSIGGTFFFQSVGTTVPTNVIMKVGRKAPQAGPFGLEDIDSPVSTITSPLGTLHELEATPLVPGTHYFAVVRLSDAQGNWSIIKHEFDTLKRTVKIDFEEIKIHDDSDFDLFGLDDDGEAKFWLKIFKGDKVDKEFSFGEIDISDKTYNAAKNKIPLNFTHTLGPETFDGNDPGVGIGAEGKEYDKVTFIFTWFYTTDDAEYWHPGRPNKKDKAIIFPYGRGNEVVADKPESVTAGPKPDDGSLHFTVRLKYSATYA
jgi:hypothetical protein